MDGILNAVCAQIVGNYADAGMAQRRPAAPLAPWQEKRAKESMDDGACVSLAELAQECGLSVAHFGRAFRGTTGVSPHQWLLSRRIAKAEALLANTRLALSQIALECGFANQSHFTNVFKKFTNDSPGSWRHTLDSPGHDSAAK